MNFAKFASDSESGERDRTLGAWTLTRGRVDFDQRRGLLYVTIYYNSTEPELQQFRE